MGMIIRPHEIYFGSFFEHFNMRFGPSDPVLDPVWRSGGIVEIAALQKQFQIFRPDRPFVESAALLGLGGLLSGAAKDRWIEYLCRLPHMRSDDAAQNGDQRIVTALARNLEASDPLPCFMQAHDGRKSEPGFVEVREASPVFYLDPVRFLTIHLPMRPSGEGGPIPADSKQP